MSDLHGNFLDYDYIRKRPSMGGLVYVHQFVEQERRDTTQHVILLNGGDVLQGEMQIYYYNYVDRRGPYMPAVFFNRVGVDAGVIGNHDFEVGGHILGQFMQELESDLLGANVVYEGTLEPFFKPYTILEKGGVKIAILGLTMPIQTECVTAHLAEGLEMLDMLEPAQRWMKHIQRLESPDLIIGLFHAGFPYGADSALIGRECFKENNPSYIVENTPGFDAVVLGHLHKTTEERIVNIAGDSVWMIEPGYGGRYVAIVDFELQKIPGKKAKILSSSTKIEHVEESQKKLQPEISATIAEERKLMEQVANERVAFLLDTICNIEAFFGSSYFVDLIHKVQLDYTGADVSFASPLSTNALINPGNLTYSDLFRVYRFENTLTVLTMTGKEIKDYLEYSYSLWINRMHSPRDRLLRTKPNTPGAGRFLGRQFEISQYYFDSAAGFDYEVDVTKPFGRRVTILEMWDGERFDEKQTYTVVTNRYRTSGAGGHFELGAKITQSQLLDRITLNDNIMIRELIRREFMQQGEVVPFQYNNWKFVPERYVIPAKEREILELKERAPVPTPVE
jgi:2',3'-cyclic-nucleotide 2'-phosphodiesterase/3'-nucleotidase